MADYRLVAQDQACFATCTRLLLFIIQDRKIHVRLVSCGSPSSTTVNTTTSLWQPVEDNSRLIVETGHKNRTEGWIFRQGQGHDTGFQGRSVTRLLSYSSCSIFRSTLGVFSLFSWSEFQVQSCDTATTLCPFTAGGRGSTSYVRWCSSNRCNTWDLVSGVCVMWWVHTRPFGSCWLVRSYSSRRLQRQRSQDGVSHFWREWSCKKTKN